MFILAYESIMFIPVPYLGMVGMCHCTVPPPTKETYFCSSGVGNRTGAEAFGPPPPYRGLHLGKFVASSYYLYL